MENYSEDKMEHVREKVVHLMTTLAELEKEFPGRPFTLDGNPVGSVGEVMAAYYYGLSLYPPSTEGHDGEVDGRRVQIKTTQKLQGGRVNLAEEPEWLIVLLLSKDGSLKEIYNGPGTEVWKNAGKVTKTSVRPISVSKLLQLDKNVSDDDRIKTIHGIEKIG